MRLAKSITPALLVLIVGLLVYWAGLSGGFIFDDYANLVRDADWKATSLTVAELKRAMAHGIASDIGRPFALLSFALNHVFTGLSPFPLKLTSLAFHLLNGLLVWRLCSELFDAAPAAREKERMGQFAAALIAVAWVAHPLQASTVLYVVQRMEVGAHTGVLLALLAYIRARAAQTTGLRAWPWFAAAVLATVFGLGFKESALLAPLYAFAIELFALHFRGAGGRRCKTLLALYILGGGLALIVFTLLILPKYTPEWAYAGRHFTLYERLLTQLHVLTTYLGQMLYPRLNSLVFYYDNFPVSHSLLAPPATLISAVALLLSAGFAWFSRVRWPLASLGITWFFAAHALTSNVIPLELAFEHRNYFALLGIMIAAGQILAAAGACLHLDARRTLAVLPVAILAILCAIQAHTWGDPLRLAIALASRNPESPRASYDLGHLMLQHAGSDRTSPLLSLAAKEFEHSAKLPASSPLAEQALIILRSRTGQEVPSEVWESLQNKIGLRRLGPQEISALRGLLDCRIQYQCPLADQQLLDTFIIALEKNPNSATLNALYSNFAYSVLRDPDLALMATRRSIELDPRNLQYKVNLARLLGAIDPDSKELAELVKTIRQSDTHGVYGHETANFFRSSPASRI